MFLEISNNGQFCSWRLIGVGGFNKIPFVGRADILSGVTSASANIFSASSSNP